MAELPELPNVDIFDPVHRLRAWQQCATQQQINIYLNKQIGINRDVLIKTIKAQNVWNEYFNTSKDDHEKRIKDLEDRVNTLDEKQLDLENKFLELNTNVNNFELRVTETLDLYQTTINQLTSNLTAAQTSIEELWNEVNELKRQFDPDLLNEAISGYQNILDTLKADITKLDSDLREYVDAQDKILDDKITELKQFVEDNLKDFDNEIADNYNKIIEMFNNYRNEVNANLEQQNQRITNFITSMDLSFQELHDWVHNEVIKIYDRIQVEAEKAYDDNSKLYDQVTGERLESEFKINQIISNLRNAVNAKDEDLQKQINDNFASLTTSIINLEAYINQQIEFLNDKISSNALDISELKDRLDKLEESDSKQWDTINNILARQNSLDNEFINTRYKINLLDEEISEINEKLHDFDDKIESNKEAINVLSDHVDNLDPTQKVYVISQQEEDVTNVYEIENLRVSVTRTIDGQAIYNVNTFNNLTYGIIKFTNPLNGIYEQHFFYTPTATFTTKTSTSTINFVQITSFNENDNSASMAAFDFDAYSVILSRRGI